MLVGRKIRLYPTKEQEKQFFSFSNASRFAYNESLAFKIKQYQETGYSCKVQDLIKHLQDLKYNYKEYSWLQSIPEAITKQAIKDLDQAYKLFFRRGNKGFPKFKSKKHSKLSFYQRTDNLRMIDDRHIKLTGIKTPVKVRENIGIDFKNPRVSYDGKFWYLSFSYEIQEPEKKTEGETIGVDLGIKSLAVTSDEEFYENINKSKRVKKLERRKKNLQRKLSKKYEMNKQGKKFIKTKNIIKLERQIKLVDRKLKNIRDTYIHTITYRLVSRAKTICIEDLNVSGIMKNKYLSEAIQQQEFYKFRHYIEYKCQGYGTNLIVADRFYPSSKTTSCCGYKFNFLSLSQRQITCPICGKTIDRDLNAAINLRNYALAQAS